MSNTLHKIVLTKNSTQCYLKPLVQQLVAAGGAVRVLVREAPIPHQQLQPLERLPNAALSRQAPVLREQLEFNSPFINLIDQMSWSV